VALHLIVISKDEAQAIRAHYPEVHIRRTAKQKSRRHRYWMTEEPQGVNYIAKLRGVSPSSLTRIV